MSRGPDAEREEALINRGPKDSFGCLLLREILEFSEAKWGAKVDDIISRLRSEDPFVLLVRTVLSQNTSSRNSTKAFKRLERSVGISPKSLSEAPLAEMEEAIKVAGLYRERARRLKKLARLVLKEYGGNLSWIKSLSLEEARGRLLMMPGIGFKTADIMLAFYGGKPVLPIDTHIRRLAIRLGLAKATMGYESIREILESCIAPEDRARAHLLLIAFGREICRARKPLCNDCPIKDSCPSRHLQGGD